jgi:hypothetical protein
VHKNAEAVKALVGDAARHCARRALTPGRQAWRITAPTPGLARPKTWYREPPAQPEQIHTGAGGKSILRPIEMSN